MMKRILFTVAIALIVSLQFGCAARTTVGNRDQHGASVSAKTKGVDRGVRANVY